MADVPMQYSPELSKAVLENLQKGIEQRRMQAVAQAQGNAVTRGISGSGWEGKQVGVANMSAQDEATQAALDMAIKNADYANRMREIEQGQVFQTSERLGSQSFSTGERKDTQTFTAQQAALDRQAQIDAAMTAYERSKSSDKRNNRARLMESGVSALGSGAGAYFGSF